MVIGAIPFAAAEVNVRLENCVTMKLLTKLFVRPGWRTTLGPNPTTRTLEKYTNVLLSLRSRFGSS